jgi:hypothetical protein
MPTKRDAVPPMPTPERQRPRDVLLTPTEPASAPPAPEYVKTSTYLRPDQIALLDELRSAHRRAGRRSVSASDLFRTAIDLAERHRDEWGQLVEEAAR